MKDNKYEMNEESDESKKTKKKKWTIIPILILIFWVGIFVYKCASPYLINAYIAWQLNNKYGLTLGLFSDDVKHSEGYDRVLITVDGFTTFIAEVDEHGKVINDSYPHIYYADEIVNDVRDDLGDMEDVCVIVNAEDYYTTFYDLDGIQTYDDYKENCQTSVRINIYVRESAGDEVAVNVLKALRENSTYVNYKVIMIDDNWFDLINNSEMIYYIRDDQAVNDLGIDGSMSEDVQAIFFYDQSSSYGNVNLLYSYISVTDTVIAHDGDKVTTLSAEEYLEMVD